MSLERGPGVRGVPVRWWVVAAVVVVVVVGLVVWLGSRGGEGGGDGSASGSPSGVGSPSGLPSTNGLGSPVGSPSPGQSEPGVAQTPSTKAGVVRADLGEVAQLGGGVSVEVVRFESVQGVARGAGERSGPAVRFTVELRNGTDAELDLRAVTVTAYVGPDRVPVGELSGPGARPFPASVAAGESVTGVNVFRIVPRDRGDVRIDVSYRGESPTAIFTGSVS